MQARRLLGDLSVRGMQGVLAFGKKNKKTFLELEKAGLDLSEQIDTNCLMTRKIPMRIGNSPRSGQTKLPRRSRLRCFCHCEISASKTLSQPKLQVLDANFSITVKFCQAAAENLQGSRIHHIHKLHPCLLIFLRSTGI